MIKNYLIVAYRNMVRGKLYALINILGLAVGMAGTFLVLVYIQGEVGFDSHHANLDRIYRVTTVAPVWDMVSAGSAYPLAEAASEAIPEVEAVARLVSVPTRVKTADGHHREYCMSAGSNVFDVFSWPLVEGDARHVLIEPNSVVLTESVAEKYFGNAAAVGQTLQTTVRNLEYQLTVVGVMEDHPRKATLRPRMLVSEEIGREYHRDIFKGSNLVPAEDWNMRQTRTYLLLAEDADPVSVESALGSMLTRLAPENINISLRLQPLGDIYFGSTDLANNHLPEGNLRVMFTVAGIAGLVLFLAVANFVVLTTAQLITRCRELIMRRVVGASIVHLAFQLLAESGLMVAIALPVALGLVELGLPQINAWFGVNLDVSGSLGAFILGVVLVASLIVIISTTATVLHISRTGMAKPGLTRHAAPRGRTILRRGVVLVQLAILAGLFVGVGVVVKQVRFATSEDPGYALHDLASAYLGSEEARQKYQVLKTELERCPGVISVSGASLLPPYDGYAVVKVTSPIDPEVTISVESMMGDFGLIETLGLELSAGRSFERELDADNNLRVVINETMAAALGLDDPIGTVITGQTVIGVLKDFHFHSMRLKIEPMKVTLHPEYVSDVAVRLDPQARSEAMEAINDVWDRINPDVSEGFSAADDKLAAMYYEERNFGDVVTFFSLLAAAIAGMGLFGLSSFVAKQRTKEIGIRKTMGASMGHLVRVLVQEHFILVLAANVLAGPPAYWVMNKWLDNFVYKTTIGWEVFVLSGMLTLVLSTATVGLHSIKTARANPVEALRCE